MAPNRTASAVKIPKPPPLPVVSYRKVEDDTYTHHVGVANNTARNYGYNDAKDFERPDHYIRYIEPIEAELQRQVEYDMDEQDEEWLTLVNAERRSKEFDTASHEMFEVIMDRLEKEWFELMKHVPKDETALPSEDSPCAICDDGEGENSNAIVFCDGCNLAVHQDCYGVPYIPEGQWLCRKCTVAPETAVSCILCPNEGGAFKQTAEAKWAHLLCAIWVPETTVGNQVFMEPIEHVDKIPKNRWKLTCSLCSNRAGACIQCDNRSCFTAFHVTCARSEGFLSPMKSVAEHHDGEEGTADMPLRAFCEKHLPDDMRANRPVRPDPTIALTEPDPKSSKTSRAYSKTFKLGAPLVPALVVNNIIDYIHRFKIRDKPNFILSVCKYWSLKREARRGAPLLKRLHLEPWTASSRDRQHTDEEKQRRLQHLQTLRGDLERVRMLSELARKRENQKGKQAGAITTLVKVALFPYNAVLLSTFETIAKEDRQRTFTNPIPADKAPGYAEVVKTPMWWELIREKLKNYEYLDLQEFKDDVNLIFDNAIAYYKPDMGAYKLAARIKTFAEPLLDALTPPTTSTFNIGSLEPPIEILRMIYDAASLASDTSLLLEPDPLSSLFQLERERHRPDAVVAPTPAKGTKSTAAKSTLLKRERAEKKREKASLNPSPFGLRTTRASMAAGMMSTGSMTPDVLDGQEEEEMEVDAVVLDDKMAAQEDDAADDAGPSMSRPENEEEGAGAGAGAGDDPAAEKMKLEEAKRLARQAKKREKTRLAKEARERNLEAGRLRRLREKEAKALAKEKAEQEAALAMDVEGQEREELDFLAEDKEDAAVPVSPSQRRRGKAKGKEVDWVPGMGVFALDGGVVDGDNIAAGTGSKVPAPLVVESVSEHDSFSMFEAGWVLPPGAKRGGRVSTERMSVPPEIQKPRGRKKKSPMKPPADMEHIPKETLSTPGAGPSSLPNLFPVVIPAPRRRGRPSKKALTEASPPPTHVEHALPDDSESTLPEESESILPDEPELFLSDGPELVLPGKPEPVLHDKPEPVVSITPVPETDHEASIGTMDVESLQVQGQPYEWTLPTPDTQSSPLPQEMEPTPQVELETTEVEAVPAKNVKLEDDGEESDLTDLSDIELDEPVRASAGVNGNDKDDGKAGEEGEKETSLRRASRRVQKADSIKKKRKSPPISKDDAVEEPPRKRRRQGGAVEQKGAVPGLDESDLTDEDELNVIGQETTKKGKGKRKSNLAEFDITSEEILPGTLVWASNISTKKSMSKKNKNDVPGDFWPAVIYADDDERIPADVIPWLETRRRQTKINRIYVVSFFDQGRSWGTASERDILMLGEDEAVDSRILGRKGFKSEKQKTDFPFAYERALAAMEEPPPWLKGADTQITSETAPEVIKEA